MHRTIILFSVALVLALTATRTVAQPPKKPSGILYIMKPTPAVYAVEPKIEAVLLLTATQRSQIQQAHAELFNTAELKQLGLKYEDKTLSDKERKSALAALALARSKASAKFAKRVDEILTANQKATINNVANAYRDAQKQVGPLGPGKSKEEQKTHTALFRAAFAQRLQSILTGEQKAALAKANAK